MNMYLIICIIINFFRNIENNTGRIYGHIDIIIKMSIRMFAQNIVGFKVPQKNSLNTGLKIVSNSLNINKHLFEMRRCKMLNGEYYKHDNIVIYKTKEQLNIMCVLRNSDDCNKIIDGYNKSIIE